MRLPLRASLLTTAFSATAVAAAPTSQPATQPASPDQTFIVKAAQGGLEEVTLGRLAATQADAQAVRDFGRMMVSEHSTANDQLLTIALQENVSPPKGLSGEGQAMYDKLSGLHGTDFDKAYVQGMIEDHQQDITEFQAEVDHGSDQAVKDWARSSMPMLHHHLDVVQGLSSGMGK